MLRFVKNLGVAGGRVTADRCSLRDHRFDFRRGLGFMQLRSRRCFCYCLRHDRGRLLSYLSGLLMQSRLVVDFDLCDCDLGSMDLNR